MSRFLKFAPVITALILLAASDVAKAQNLLVNAGFEDPMLASGGYRIYTGGQNIGGWSVVGNGVLLLQTNYEEAHNGVNPFEAQEGLNSLDLTGDGNQGLSSGVQQTIATTIGTTYDLSFYVGRASGNQFYATPSSADVSIDGGVRIAYTNSSITPGMVNWKQFTTSFVATQSNTIVTFYNGTTDNAEVGLDNVVLTGGFSAVPEPSALALLISAGVTGTSLFLRCRRK